MRGAQRETMRRYSKGLCLWPGLPQLWASGSWQGLALAVGFSCLLNSLLAVNLVWTELAAPAVLLGSWACVSIIWGVSALLAWRSYPKWGQGRGIEFAPSQDLFPQALGEYLQGNWFEAEEVCRRLLKRNQADVDASLLLASICRRTRRYDEAQEKLKDLQRLDGAAKWELEIAGEFERLSEGASGETTTVTEQEDAQARPNMLGAA